MELLTKEIGGPGTYFGPEGPVTVTEKDFDQFIESFHDLQRTEYETPVPWAHPRKDDPNGYPIDGKDKALIELRNRDRLNAGWLQDVFRDQKDGKVKVTVGLERADDIEQVKKVGAFVSPQFGSFINPRTGRKYEKCITHLCLTNRPLNADQGKTWLAQTAMSLDAALQAGPIQCAAADSYAVTAENTPPGTTPPYPTDPNDPTDPDDPEGKKPSTRQRLVGCARSLGIMVPENWKKADLDVFCAALETYAQSQQGHGLAGPEGGRGQQNGKDPKAPLRQEPTVLVMSADVKKILDDQVAAGKITKELADQITSNPAMTSAFQMSVDAAVTPPGTPPPAVVPPAPAVTPVAAPAPATPQPVQMSATETALMGQVTTMKRAEYGRRIDECLKLGKAVPAQLDPLRTQASQYQFSAETQAGDALLEAKLSAFESNRAYSAIPMDQQMQQMGIQTQGRDGFMRDQVHMSEEEARAIEKDVFDVMLPFYQDKPK